MAFELWLAFAVASAVLVAIPAPTVVLVVPRAEAVSLAAAAAARGQTFGRVARVVVAHDARTYARVGFGT